MKLKYLLSAVTVACASVISFDAGAQTRPTVYNPGFMLFGMSDNADYALGVQMGDENVDNPRPAGGTLVDLRTHTSKKISAPSGWADVQDVADNGIVVGSAVGKPAYWTPETGKWTSFNVPAPWGGGCFFAVTPDARYAVGYFSDVNNDYVVTPMMYDLTTGESLELKNLPKHDLTGEDQKQNVFYGISPDGRYVLGQMSQSYWMPVALFTYIYDTHNDTWRPIGYSYDEATGKFTSKLDNFYFTANQFFSCDGNWVTGSAYMVYGGGEMSGGREGFYPYRYNVKDDVFEVFDNMNDSNVGGNKITADGEVLGSSPSDSPYPSAVIRRGNFFVTLDQVIEQVYGMQVRDLVHDEVTGSFSAISADGLTAVMCTHDNTYVITMPEPFADAAARVNLLAHYSLSIPEGAAINRLSEVKITFDRTVECLDYAQNIKLLDGDGNLVRSASGFQISPTNDHSVVVSFRSTTLTPDMTYTIDIPEGMIWLKEDHSIKSEAIQIHYKGRQNIPVAVVRADPVSGSAVAEFNPSPDNVRVTFDTPVSVSSTGQCTLYNADDNTVVGSFTAVAEGSTVTFSPLGTYYLYKGSHYKLVIAAGTVCDLSGNGGNEEIVLNYIGTYVRQVSSDDIFLFKSTCDNYDDFMFWKDEFNTPASTPASWGFTEETPWVLVRDDESSTDMALASHSMFTPAGESDSWLITPQIYIPDANALLTFDTQSYMRSRDDVLKVYICVDNASYNYFNAELKEKFINKGDLVIDEVISAGATNESLAGEWTHKVLSLSKYAGKNIYIAFVNNNVNKSAIFIDNVQVMRSMTFLVTNQTPAVMVDADKATVSGILSIGSELAVFNGVTFTLSDADGNVISTIDDSNVTLAQGDTYNFTFPDPIELVPGTMIDYNIQVSSGEVSSIFTYTLKDLIFQTTKRVVLEEFTGSACGNCPLGIRAIETLEQIYPDTFIPMTLRTYNGDIHSAGAIDYTSYLGMNAAPSGRINRGEILSPSVQNGSAGIQFFGNGLIDSDGNKVRIWGDAVAEELSVPAEAEVNFTAAYDEATGQIVVPCDVRFALNRENMSLGVFAVVLEDNLRTYQTNYYNKSEDPALGEWGVGGMYSQATVTTWLANDVVRFVVNGTAFNGTVMPQSDFVAGTDYSITLDAKVPTGRLDNPANCKVVVMLIDRTTGHVINANRGALTLAGINGIEADDDGDVEYYNLSGMKVAHPVSGQIYIKVKGGKATKVRM